MTEDAPVLEGLASLGNQFAIALVVAFSAGMLLGMVFFWGLWMTVNRIHAAPRPGVRILGSLLLRFVLVAAGLFVVTRYGGWQPLIAAAMGFLLSRFLMVRRVLLRRPGQEGD